MRNYAILNNRAWDVPPEDLGVAEETPWEELDDWDDVAPCRPTLRLVDYDFEPDERPLFDGFECSECGEQLEPDDDRWGKCQPCRTKTRTDWSERERFCLDCGCKFNNNPRTGPRCWSCFRLFRKLAMADWRKSQKARRDHETPAP